MTRCAHLLPILPALLAAACATVPAAERAAICQATEWHGYGVNDGVLGVAPGQRRKFFADCADLGFPADIDAYEAGRAEGLKRYCTVENGHEVGFTGRRYRNVCPPELEADFLQGYAQGRRERPAYLDPYYAYDYYGAPFWYDPFWSYRHPWHHHR